jgi:hypothetical protein
MNGGRAISVRVLELALDEGPKPTLEQVQRLADALVVGDRHASLSSADRLNHLSRDLFGVEPHNTPFAPHRDRIPEPLVAQQRLAHGPGHGRQDSRQVLDPLERRWLGIWRCGHRCFS